MWRRSLQEGAMRPQDSTLTARRVHRCAAAILQHHLQLPDHGPKCRAGPLLTLLFYAAARITSLSDACQSLRAATSDEAARLALIAYHGQPLHDPDEIYRSQAKSGTSHFHAYATLYVVCHGYRFTVALTTVS